MNDSVLSIISRQQLSAADIRVWQPAYRLESYWESVTSAMGVEVSDGDRHHALADQLDRKQAVEHLGYFVGTHL